IQPDAFTGLDLLRDRDRIDGQERLADARKPLAVLWPKKLVVRQHPVGCQLADVVDELDRLDVQLLLYVTQELGGEHLRAAGARGDEGAQARQRLPDLDVSDRPRRAAGVD